MRAAVHRPLGWGAGVIRVLLADDQALVRGALAAMLGLEADIEVVAQVGSGAEVVAAATAHRVDVALLDVQMPGGDGLDAAAAAARRAAVAAGSSSSRRSGAPVTWRGRCGPGRPASS